jgi:hypothetical protein
MPSRYCSVSFLHFSAFFTVGFFLSNIYTGQNEVLSPRDPGADCSMRNSLHGVHRLFIERYCDTVATVPFDVIEGFAWNGRQILDCTLLTNLVMG